MGLNCTLNLGMSFRASGPRARSFGSYQVLKLRLHSKAGSAEPPFHRSSARQSLLLFASRLTLLHKKQRECQRPNGTEWFSRYYQNLPNCI
jgi:hypothetical protein